MNQVECPCCKEPVIVPNDAGARKIKCDFCGTEFYLPRPCEPEGDRPRLGNESARLAPESQPTVVRGGSEPLASLDVPSSRPDEFQTDPAITPPSVSKVGTTEGPQSRTRVCEWCAERVPALAFRCPKCQRWGREIQQELDRKSTCLVLIIACSCIGGMVIGQALVGGRGKLHVSESDYPWHVKVHEKPHYRPGPGNIILNMIEAQSEAMGYNYRWEFSFDRFLKSWQGLCVIACAVVTVIAFAVFCSSCSILKEMTGSHSPT